jgi:hypothetical protein
MKMSKNTLLKKIEQGYRENYCNGEYTLNLVTENKEESMYVLKYTYETGEEIAITITSSYLGKVSFYSHIHHYYISNFSSHTKSVINVMRLLFDLIDCNKDDMLEYYRTVETKETDETENNDIKGNIYIDTDSVKVAPLPEQQTSEESITDTIIADDNSSYNIEVLRAKQDLNTKYSNSYRKHLHAIINPEWHHVSLATLANIDNDMLDEKRRHYMKVYRMTANVINSIYKCNKLTSIDKLRTNLIQTVRTMAKNEKIEWALVQYVKAKIDNCYLVNGLQSSFYSKTYGHNKSRSYTKTFFI